MWRSLFVALGVSSIILGVECLLVDKAVLANRAAAAAPTKTGAPPAAVAKREVTPPDWAPWSLMSTGSVVVLYSFTLPRRVG